MLLYSELYKRVLESGVQTKDFVIADLCAGSGTALMALLNGLLVKPGTGVHANPLHHRDEYYGKSLELQPFGAFASMRGTL